MITKAACQEVLDLSNEFANGTLPDEQRLAVEQHLQTCAACNDKLSQICAAQGAENKATGSEDLNAETVKAAPAMTSWLASAPWWGVSVALHVLVILLASLISMSMNLPKNDDAVVMMTQLEQAPSVQAEQVKPTNDNHSALESKHDTPPTDPTSKEESDIVVPPDHYFAMGDHRGVSLDSRYWGFIPKENVIGRPMFIYWSFETPDNQYRKTAWSDRLLFLGKVVLHFFDETRWKRTFQVVR